MADDFLIFGKMLKQVYSLKHLDFSINDFTKQNTISLVNEKKLEEINLPMNIFDDF